MEWLTIIGMALNLMNSAELGQEYELRIKWGKPAVFFMNTTECDSIMVVEFIKKDSRQKVELLLVPWQDIFFSEDEHISVLQPQLLTVEKGVLIFKFPDSTPETGPEKLNSALNTLFETERNNNPEDNPAPIHGHYQVINHKEFPNYAILEIAKPGSKPADPQEIAGIFPGKMVRLSVVPDIGKVHTSWIKGKPENIPASVMAVFKSALEKALQKPNNEKRQAIYKKSLEALESESAGSYFAKLLSRYLLIGQTHQDIPGIDPVFGNYQPKLTPDNAIDFMPGIALKIDSLPSAGAANMVELAILFSKYKKLTEQNPGKWVEGNIILGAKPEEYIPSEEELILNEIGERINSIICNNDLRKIKKRLKKEGLWNKKFCYTHFTFIHYDVMGSGRFFYVEGTDNKCVIVKNKHQ